MAEHRFALWRLRRRLVLCDGCAGCGYGGADLDGVAFICACCAGRGVDLLRGRTVRVSGDAAIAVFGSRA